MGLLNTVVATKGEYYTIVSIEYAIQQNLIGTDKPTKTKSIKQFSLKTIEECNSKVAEIVAAGNNAFFALGKSKSPDRNADNMEWFKSVFLDIDCKGGHEYQSINEGITALKKFCKDVGLPKPTIVNSGNGIHVYWPFTEDVHRDDWIGIASLLKAVAQGTGLDIDPTATTDYARVLRVDDTINTKQWYGQGVLPVTVICYGTPTDAEELRNALQTKLTTLAPEKQEPLAIPGMRPKGSIPENDESYLLRVLSGNKQYSFAKILRKTDAGVGCEQLKYIYTNQNSITEPLWRSGLSIAKFCSDGKEYAHKMSDQYEGYSYDETEKKLAGIHAPHFCSTFEQHNQPACAKCPNRGKVRTPIVLGEEIIRATESDNIIEEESEVLQEMQEFKIPDYPFPYFRGKNGGVYKHLVDTEDDQLIYENDFYPVKLMIDADGKHTVWLRLHTPKDGVRDFTMPLADIGATDTCRAEFMSRGVIALGKQMAAIQQYVNDSNKKLQAETRGTPMPKQFGWTEHGSFLLGTMDISPTTHEYIPPASSTKSLAHVLSKKGSFEDWKEVISVYGREGMEPYAYAILSALGSPLIKAHNLNGVITNMISSQTGTGKTTAMEVAASFYGNPKALMLSKKDTTNAKLLVLGVLNNLPGFIDEITNISAEALSELVYDISQCRGKHRMKSQSNELRENEATWNMMVTSTSNASVRDKLKKAKHNPAGELARVIEYTISPENMLPKAEADEIFGKIYSNYGHAGIIYLDYLVSNHKSVVEQTKKMQKIIDKAINLTSSDRFISIDAACRIVGGIIAQKLGLLPEWDMKRVYSWAVTMLNGQRIEVTHESYIPNKSILSDFISSMYGELLIVDKAAPGAAIPMPHKQPNNTISARLEPNTNRLYIPNNVLRDYCVKYQINMDEFLHVMEQSKTLIHKGPYRLLTGTGVAAPPVRCYVFQLSDEDIADVDGQGEGGGVEEDAG